ncbi:MAG TPA: cyclic nucleotide-binding domain-containing protein [Pirellulales bacterium]|nr:cyclic nucleotide-binding domain-containing protein [Pirellulales bacterium]
MIDKQALRDALRQLGFAADLPDRVVEELAKVSALVDFPAGSVVFHEGTENHFLYLLCSGHIGLDMYVPGRGRVRILSLGPGEMLAWSALLGDGKMTVSATALDDLRAVAMAAPKLRELCEADHEVGFQFMSRMAHALAQRLLATRLQLLDLFAEPKVTSN